jgi:mannose-6-phosphate isomerase-like protein (cupin superfamily)
LAKTLSIALETEGDPDVEVNSTIRVFHESDVNVAAGPEGQVIKTLVGTESLPTDRIRLLVATFEAGTTPFQATTLHWFLIETAFYVVSGRALIRDIEGHSYEVGPGSVIYVPPGVAGAFEWEFKERTKLIGIRASTDPEKNIQFNIADKSTLESSVTLDYLVKRGLAELKSFY